MTTKTKSNAERQAAYRARRYNAGPNGNPEYRISTWISSEARFALKRLAAHHEVTSRQLLERMIVEADEKLIKSFSEADLERYLSRDLSVTQ